MLDRPREDKDESGPEPPPHKALSNKTPRRSVAILTDKRSARGQTRDAPRRDRRLLRGWRGVRGLVTRLDEVGWRTPTPAPRWTVADQVAHLALDQPAQAVAERTPYTGRRQYSAAS